MPALSRDGEFIAFRSDRNGGDLYVMGATGDSPRRLTEFGYNPAWSPDERLIVFDQSGSEDSAMRTARSCLWIVEVDTGKTMMLYEGDGIQPSSSPYGHPIASPGIDSEKGYRIWTIPIGGTTPTRAPGP